MCKQCVNTTNYLQVKTTTAASVEWLLSRGWILSVGWCIAFYLHWHLGLADRQHSKYAWSGWDPSALGHFHRQPLCHSSLSDGQPHFLPHHTRRRHHCHGYCQTLQDAGLQLHSGENENVHFETHLVRFLLIKNFVVSETCNHILDQMVKICICLLHGSIRFCREVLQLCLLFSTCTLVCVHADRYIHT